MTSTSSWTRPSSRSKAARPDWGTGTADGAGTPLRSVWFDARSSAFISAPVRLDLSSTRGLAVHERFSGLLLRHRARTGMTQQQLAARVDGERFRAP